MSSFAPTTAAPAKARRMRNDAARNALMEQWLPLVEHVVARMPHVNGAVLDRDDLCAAGNLGLLRAAETWDESRGASFKSYAYTAIRGAVLDELRRHDPVPRPRRDRLRAMERVGRDLRATLQRPPTLEELGEALGVSANELDDDLTALHACRRLSLDDHGDTGGDADQPLGPAIAPAADVDDPADAAAFHERCAQVADAIGELPERERHVIVLYHQQDLYLREIARVLGVTDSRVCQILARATARLRLALQTDDEPPGG